MLMALLNYERMLNADRFCLCQLSQQPQLQKLIPTTFSIGGGKKRASGTFGTANQGEPSVSH